MASSSRPAAWLGLRRLRRQESPTHRCRGPCSCISKCRRMGSKSGESANELGGGFFTCAVATASPNAANAMQPRPAIVSQSNQGHEVGLPSSRSLFLLGRGKRTCEHSHPPPLQKCDSMVRLVDHYTEESGTQSSQGFHRSPVTWRLSVRIVVHSGFRIPVSLSQFRLDEPSLCSKSIFPGFPELFLSWVAVPSCAWSVLS